MLCSATLVELRFTASPEGSGSYWAAIQYSHVLLTWEPKLVYSFSPVQYSPILTIITKVAPHHPENTLLLSLQSILVALPRTLEQCSSIFFVASNEALLDFFFTEFACSLFISENPNAVLEYQAKPDPFTRKIVQKNLTCG